MTEAPQEARSNRPAPSPADAAARARRSRNWMRFWIEVLVAAFVFNVIAGFITWKWILPHLHR